jgi:hypothetical protein
MSFFIGIFTERIRHCEDNKGNFAVLKDVLDGKIFEMTITLPHGFP